MVIKNSLKIAFVYTGTILGAGFATGKELVNFFAKFGNTGIFSFFVSCFLLSLGGIAILDIINKSNAKTYREFLNSLFGERVSFLIEIFNSIFLFVLFSAMLAGGGATISMLLPIGNKVSILLFSIIVFVAIFWGNNIIVNINSFLCPILIIGGMFVGIYIYLFQDISVFSNNTKAIVSSFVYMSYNTITTISVLFAIRNLITSKKVVMIGGSLSGVFIFFIGIFMLIPLTKNYNYIFQESLPILSLIRKDYFIKIIYSIVVFVAIFTTAIGNGFALESIIFEKIKINSIIIKMLLFTFGIGLSLLGFSNMVEKIYPIFGYLGIFEILIILILFLFNIIDK